MNKTLENATSLRGAGGEEPSPAQKNSPKMSEPELVVTKSGVVTETYNVTVGGVFLTVEVTHEDGYINHIRIHTHGKIIELTNRQLQAIIEVIKHYRVK